MLAIRVAVIAWLGAQAVGFPLADYHTHLKEGLQLADILRRDRELGIKSGVAVNGGLSFPINTDAGLESFLREMQGQPVFVAFQAEGREWVRLFSRPTLQRFDYIFTDAMTWSDDKGNRMRLWIDREVPPIADAQKFMNMLVDRTVQIISEEPIDLYVNPTFLPNQISARYDELWTPQRMDRVIGALRDHGVGLEINNRYMIPSAAFIRKARAAGVKLACGTNNSGPHDLGRLEYCISMIRQVGLAAADMWTPPAEGFKAIQRRSGSAAQ